MKETGDQGERKADKKEGRKKKKRAEEGGQSHKARSKSSLMFRMEGAQMFGEGMKCV